MDRAIQEVEACTAEIEVGKTYRGIVRGVKEFGAFVECLPGKEGLVHISELADFRVNKTEDICKLSDEMIVKGFGIEKGKVRLSRKAALEDSKPQLQKPLRKPQQLSESQPAFKIPSGLLQRAAFYPKSLHSARGLIEHLLECPITSGQSTMRKVI